MKRNYFNYFTEIEEYFIRKRAKSLLVSPLDWCLIELWKENGIPVHIVLRGIDRSFESAQDKRRKPPNTLFYCHPAILEAFEEYSQAMVGASPQDDPAENGHSSQPVLKFLDELAFSLKDRQSEVFERAAERLGALMDEISKRDEVLYEEIDQDLGKIGAWLAEHLQKQIDPNQLKQIKKEVKKEMRLYKMRLSTELYERLERSYLDRRIRELFGLPEFSLFAAEIF
ncbi:MAG: hypothetical protein ACRD1R_19270 [Acidobacteriota bacterium]